MSGGPASVNLKIVLIVIALIIAASTLFYTKNLVEKIQKREKEIVELYANSFEYIVNSNESSADLTFIFENIIKRIDFPLLLTNNKGEVSLGGLGGGYKNIDIDPNLSEIEVKEYLNKKVKELAESHDPIEITYQDSIIFGKIYYGDSEIVQRLKFYPYLQIIFAIFFIIISYFSFSYLKKNEQSNIWVGMAKETAHQLGTPISSLMGWSEILKMSYNNPDKVQDVAEEMTSDLNRLNKIAHRFSQIGSKTELKEKNVYEIIEKVIIYFTRRLPQTDRNVELKISGDNPSIIKLNAELFEWVIENLIKNGLDAIGNKRGKIEFRITDKSNSVEIDILDNGKGIDHKRRKDIFRPGYSTKRRGWGLGLSLAKRIVEDYHSGKIYVKNSVLNEGTTFNITLFK